MSIAAGARFDRYEILSPLGKGGMGEVYLALDTQLGRKLALKLLPAQFTTDEDRLRRFQEEARAASALNHPNILTIYEIGQVQNIRFIATEFIEGQTLRQKMALGGLKLHEALDFASQLAGALAAAHAAGIVHRDIKPENIMVRPDGLIKVLDFGLAKLTESAASWVDSVAPTGTAANTEPGAVMGTPRYMSPEQARGIKIDARTDIFSLGVVIYEMIAGQNPFGGTAASEILAGILEREPPPLARFARDVPPALEWIVSKALAKEREERYQTVKDLALDLKGLRQRLELENQRERTDPAMTHGGVVASTSGGAAGITFMPPEAAPGHQSSLIRASSGTRIRLSEIHGHKLGIALALSALVLAAIAAFYYFTHRPTLNDKDTILLVDWVNTTGDTVFDGTLKQGLAVQLQQSPFLNLFPDARVRQALRQMNQPPNERLTRDVGREIAQRQGLKALIVGTIAKFDRNYSLTLEAINSQTGETIALAQVEAEGKDQVLKALSLAATQLRTMLGEALSSIQRFDKQLEETTTSKLEAFQAYALGMEQAIIGRSMESIPIFERAVEIDPDFATAYSLLSIMHFTTGRPRLAAEFAEKAYALRDRVGEYEKLRITSLYHSLVTGDAAKRIEVQILHKRMYPRDWTGPNDLALIYNQIGQFDRAIAEARESIRLNPNSAPPHAMLALGLIRLTRFAEAKDAVNQALQQKLDHTEFRSQLYQIAFINNDPGGMRQQIEWASGKLDEYVAFEWQAGAAGFAGEWRRAQGLARRATELVAPGNTREIAARLEAEQALGAAAFGDCTPAKAAAANSLTLERNPVTLTRAALVLALCAEAAQAQPIADELVKRYPQNTLINGLWLPVIRAALEVHRGHAAQAIDLTQPAIRYEAAAGFWLHYVRGQAYLKLRHGAEAAAEFQKILDHRGWAPLSALFPLAHLGLARAAAVAGDSAMSRKEYQDFFALWKNADADLPILIEARKEFAGLK